MQVYIFFGRTSIHDWINFVDNKRRSDVRRHLSRWYCSAWAHLTQSHITYTSRRKKHHRLFNGSLSRHFGVTAEFFLATFFRYRNERSRHILHLYWILAIFCLCLSGTNNVNSWSRSALVRRFQWPIPWNRTCCGLEIEQPKEPSKCPVTGDFTTARNVVFSFSKITHANQTKVHVAPPRSKMLAFRVLRALQNVCVRKCGWKVAGGSKSKSRLLHYDANGDAPPPCSWGSGGMFSWLWRSQNVQFLEHVLVQEMIF